jgi:hypothetical protein
LQKKSETQYGLLANLEMNEHWDPIMRITENRQLAAMATRSGASSNLSEKLLKQRCFSADVSTIQPSLAVNDPLFCTVGRCDFT